MVKRTSMRIDDELMALEDRLRAKVENLPDNRWRTDLYTLALQNLADTIRNHEDYEGDPELAKQFKTRVVRPHYSTSVEVRRP